MQEQPPISPLESPISGSVSNIFRRQPARFGAGWLNIITLVGIVFVIYYTAINILSDGYEFSPANALSILSDGLQSGMLYINGEAPGMSAILCFFPLCFWCFIVLVAFLLMKKPYRKKSLIIWASILLVVCLSLTTGLWIFASLPCSLETLTGSSPVCAMPIRPGVPLPPPGP
ncbi:hypothetical protein [Ktedonobacter racemifer]|uniref:Uncharacterized protein n=1 Tax=Ktedonobacter racemifer DSM 44963 TaxID=485913 RepID=D6U107_KTERA|nr:hypothetical protein [Ktedonobacter racemifer]EFH82497.1 hypothetical protein Krac_3310 [Ktedonobacter racemifer DSM 44963]